MPTPHQIFEDTTRPVDLLLHVYSLLDTGDNLTDEGELIKSLRLLVQAAADEDLMLVYNELFLGLVREKANIPRATFKRSSLTHLLRQAVVISSTGVDTFLPALLRTNLPLMIRAKGRDFVPASDGDVKRYFEELTFSMDEILRLVGETARTNSDAYAAEYIANKILGLTRLNLLAAHQVYKSLASYLGWINPGIE